MSEPWRGATSPKHSTWLNTSKSTSLLGLCVLLQMIEHFASPPSKANSMMVEPTAEQQMLHKSGILSLLLSVTALLSLPSKLV